MKQGSYLEIESLSGKFTENTHVEDIFFCFRLILGRNPNPEEIDGHVAIGVGEDLRTVVAQYLNSKEFQERGIIDSKKITTKLVHFEGYEIYVDPNDPPIGRHIAAGSYEPHVTSVFKKYIKKDDVIVDIGANMGYFTALASYLTGPGGKVYSIEPNPQNCAFLQATKKHNQFLWQETYCIAATEYDTLMSLDPSFSNGSVVLAKDNENVGLTLPSVQGLSLDGVLKLDKLDFIKIDVERHEYEALKGFAKTIKKFKPIIVSEFTAKGMNDPQGYLNFLYSIGYSLSVINADGSCLDCAQRSDLIFDYFNSSGNEHIDLLALPEK